MCVQEYTAHRSFKFRGGRNKNNFDRILFRTELSTVVSPFATAFSEALIALIKERRVRT